LRKEIREQPRVLRRVLATQVKHIERVAVELKCAGVRNLFLVARGSSDNAALYAKYIFGIRNRMVTALAAPSMFTIYRSRPDLSEFALIAISQSGKIPEIISVVEEAREQGVLTIALTNGATSPLAQASDFVLDLSAGHERSVAATKTYTAQLFCLALLSHFMKPTKRGFDEIASIPDAVESVLAGEKGVAELAERYRFMDRCIVLGRGFNYSTAFELALKLKELCYVHAEPYSSVDFVHGPIAILEEDFPVILVAPRGRVNKGLFDIASRLKERDAEILAISDDARINRLATRKIELPHSTSEWLSPIETVVAGQLLCLHLSLAKGMNPDKPRGLMKVTKTV